MAELIKVEISREKAPQPLSLIGNIKENWERFKRDFQTYLTESGNGVLPEFGNESLPEFSNKTLPELGNKTLPELGNRIVPEFGNKPLPEFGKKALPENMKVPIFLDTVGREGIMIYNSLKMSDEDKSALPLVLIEFEKALLSRRSIVYERFTLHSRKQANGEMFDDFYNDLKILIKSCEYGDLEESILRDHIVFGIRDRRVQEALLKIVYLNLETAVEYCRNTEVSKKRSGLYGTEKEDIINIAKENDTEPVKLEGERNFSSVVKESRTSNRSEHSEAVVGVSNAINLDIEDGQPAAKFEVCYVPRNLEEVFVELARGPTLKNEPGEGVCPLRTVKNEPLEAHDDCSRDASRRSTTPNDDTVVIMNIKKLLNAEERSMRSDDPALPYSCDVCARRFALRSNLKKHLVIHTGERPHRCDVCDKRFSLQENLKRHKKIHVKRRTKMSKFIIRPYRCNICSKTFVSTGHLKQHALIHTGERPHKCDDCGKRFSSKSNLNHHKSIHKNEQHECDFCNKSFATKEYLKKHSYVHVPPLDENNVNAQVHQDSNLKREKSLTKKHHIIVAPSLDNDATGHSDTDKSIDSFPDHLVVHPLERRHKCNFCSKSFFIKQSLSSHMLVHTGERPHKCDVCGKSFSTKGHLSEHTMIHKRIRPYQCEVCKKGFLRKWNFNQHMLIHTGKQIYKCHICTKSFTIKDYLKKHSFTHLTEQVLQEDKKTIRDIDSKEPPVERSYFCNICSKGFTTKQFLDRHLLNHNDTILPGDVVSRMYRYRCNVCNKNLSGKRALETHMLTHTGGRPHQCHICSKCFSQKGSLNVHLLTHTGERPHRCEVCGKCFPSKDYLRKKHMLIHTGEKPYCCENCGKRFAVKSNMNKHMLIHKTDRPHTCDVCRKSFTRKQDLKKHMILHQRPRQETVY